MVGHPVNDEGSSETSSRLPANGQAISPEATGPTSSRPAPRQEPTIGMRMVFPKHELNSRLCRCRRGETPDGERRQITTPCLTSEMPRDGFRAA